MVNGHTAWRAKITGHFSFPLAYVRHVNNSPGLFSTFGQLMTSLMFLAVPNCFLWIFRPKETPTIDSMFTLTLNSFNFNCYWFSISSLEWKVRKTLNSTTRLQLEMLNLWKSNPKTQNYVSELTPGSMLANRRIIVAMVTHPIWMKQVVMSWCRFPRNEFSTFWKIS